MQTVTASRVGVSTSEAAQNAAVHGAHDRSTTKGVTTAEAQADAILNVTTAAE